MDCVLGSKLYLGDESVDLIITDPPYNLGFAGTNMTKDKKPRFNIIANDKLSIRDYRRFTLEWLREAFRVLKPGRHIYVFIDWRQYPLLFRLMEYVGFSIKNCIVWDKKNFGMGWQYRYQHEFVIFAVKRAKKVRRVGSRSTSDILRVPRISGNKTIHPTEKPNDVILPMIINSSEEQELVVDFFVGSGPVPEISLSNNREFIGFEIDSNYYTTALDRCGKNQEGKV
ncbi:site-specific DNA-methyltransferase [Paenibacillus sp. LMG 31459]|uniref:Methyltransferase n=2 Tax=Paenibacillus phytohabitans TaxID=2654978 RepID=A0ABX1YKY1_9BACL|nr:site-specific DNA-methyltransferase [Paenibacillus phytohabitans]